MDFENTTDQICIVGGGASGIAIAKSFMEAGMTHFDIIEKEDDFGGNWYFGKPCANVYESAHLISSKLNTQFSDYPMPESYPAFPSHRQFLAYLRDIAKHYKLYEHTRFNTSLVLLEPKPQTEGKIWRAVFSSGEEREYRNVILATGRLQKGIIPHYPGKFIGKAFHSKEYKTPDCLRGKRVLIIGSGNSGCDIAVDSVHYAEQTFLSARRPYYYLPKFVDGQTYQEWMMSKASEFTSTEAFWTYAKKIFKLAGFDGTDYGLQPPDYEIDQTHPIVNSLVLYHMGHGDIIAKPDVKRFEGNTVHFNDDTEATVDIVIYATGYENAFPFLKDEWIDLQENGMPNFFMYALHRNFDNLAFAGFVNASSGFGNLAKAGGRLLVAYLKAQKKNSHAYQVFQHLKKGKNPDLGQDRFLKTPRHRVEVDMWKLLKNLNILADKLSE